MTMDSRRSQIAVINLVFYKGKTFQLVQVSTRIASGCKDDHELNAPVPAGLPDFLKTVTSTTPWDEGTDILSFSYVASIPSIGS